MSDILEIHYGFPCDSQGPLEGWGKFGEHWVLFRRVGDETGYSYQLFDAVYSELQEQLQKVEELYGCSMKYGDPFIPKPKCGSMILVQGTQLGLPFKEDQAIFLTIPQSQVPL